MSMGNWEGVKAVPWTAAVFEAEKMPKITNDEGKSAHQVKHKPQESSGPEFFFEMDKKIKTKNKSPAKKCQAVTFRNALLPVNLTHTRAHTHTHLQRE